MVRHQKQAVSDLPDKADAAPLERRDFAYKTLLCSLTLSERHMTDLMKRGLPKEMISYLGYKSTPQENLWQISNAISEKVSLEDIPGFYGSEGAYRVVYRKPGILIPVRTLSGKIAGLQIRYDNLPETAPLIEKEKYRKYVWFSSLEKNTGISTSGCENIHHAGFTRETDISRIILTEGVLKADIAAFLGKLPVLGLTGVSNTSQLRDCLLEMKAAGTKKVFIALDSDFRTNRNVAKALRKIYRIILGTGLETQILTWDEHLKGVDDLLWYKSQKGLI